MTGLLLLVNVAYSVVTDGAFALMIGFLLADRWLVKLGPPGGRSDVPVPTGPRTLLICAGVFAACDLFHPWLLAATMSGSVKWMDVLKLVPYVVFSTHQGTVWFIQSGATALLVLTLILLKESRSRGAILVTCLIVLSFAKAAQGHAGENGDFTWSETIQALHIFLTAVWAGGVVVSGLLILPRLANPAGAFRYSRYLSRIATWSVGLLAASGAFSAWTEANGSIASLSRAAWGWTLIIKVALVLVAIGLGATNRFACLSGTQSDAKLSLLRRMLRYEALILIVVIGLSGSLGCLAPPQSM